MKDNAEAFNAWLEAEEIRTISKFINKGGQNGTYYQCNRSGDREMTMDKYEQPAKPIAKYYKMGAECPAYIKCVKDNSGKLNVTYCSTHFGHICNYQWISIPKSKFYLYCSYTLSANYCLFLGQTQMVLKDLPHMSNSAIRKKHNNIVYEPAPLKINNLMTKSVGNMRNYYQLNPLQNMQLHANEFESVKLYFERNQKDLLYYDFPITSDEKIDGEKIELAIMTPQQQQLLVLYGKKCIVMDSTHGTSPFHLQLTTIMIIDSHK